MPLKFKNLYRDSSSRPKHSEVESLMKAVTNTELMGRKNEIYKDHLDQSKMVSPSYVGKLIRLNSPEWPYAFLGSLGAIMAGVEGPLFAFGITHALTMFYAHDKQHMKQEITRICFVFISAAFIPFLFIYCSNTCTP